MEVYAMFILKIWMKPKDKSFFINFNIKMKLNFLIHSKLKLQPRT